MAADLGKITEQQQRMWSTGDFQVPDLLEIAQRRARAEGLPLRTQVADVQQLPFDDDTFDVVTSTFGAMFAPDQERTAAELVRVLRRGGRLGMANWIPQSWVGAQFALRAQFLPSPSGLLPPSVWGTEERLRELFGSRISALEIGRKYADFCHHDTAALFEQFRDWFGPTATAWRALEEPQRGRFRDEWIALAEKFNVARDGTCEIPADYLEVVAVAA